MKEIPLILLLALSTHFTALGQIDRAELLVEGLDIDSLRSRLEERLRQLDGISQVKSFPSEDRVELTISKRDKVNLAGVEPAVQAIGLSLQYWKLAARGELTHWNGQPALFIRENKLKLLLQAVAREEANKLETLLKNSTNEPVSVEGTLQRVQAPDSKDSAVKVWIEKLSTVSAQNTP